MNNFTTTTLMNVERGPTSLKPPQYPVPVKAAVNGQAPRGSAFAPSIGLDGSHVSQLRLFPRKRRIYADYRELLAFESAARKLNFSGIDSTRVGQEHRPSLRNPMPKLKDRRNYQDGSDATTVDRGQLDLPITAPAERRALLLVDQRMNMFFGSQRNLKSVVAINAAALIAWRILMLEKRLAAIVFNDRSIVQFYPGCSRLHTLLILQTMLNQNHRLPPQAGTHSNPRMLNNALRRVSRQVTGNTFVFVITDASGCNEETTRLMTKISEQNDLLAALVYDPQQAEFCNLCGGLNGSLRVTAVSGGGRLLENKDQTVAGHHPIFLNRVFPEGVPVVPLNTRHNVAHQLRRAFANSIDSLFSTGRIPPTAAPLSNAPA
jgi:hypothetical protein